MLRRCLLAVIPLLLCLCAAGCSRVVVDSKGELKDGGKWEFPLERGTYRVEMTANGDGAAVEWQGCECREAKSTRDYRAECRLGGGGKLIVRNPSLLHMGAPTQVKLKVTRLPR